MRTALSAAFGSFESRAYVDTGPVAEKAYAVAGGSRELREEHLRAQSAPRFLVLHRRPHHRPRPRRRMRPPRISAARAAPASTPAPPRPFPSPTSSMRAAASATSPSRSRTRSIRSFAARWAGTSSAATSARTSARGTASARSRAARPSSRGRETWRPSFEDLARLSPEEFQAALPEEPGQAVEAARAPSKPGRGHRQRGLRRAPVPARGTGERRRSDRPRARGLGP